MVGETRAPHHCRDIWLASSGVHFRANGPGRKKQDSRRGIAVGRPRFGFDHDQVPVGQRPEHAAQELHGAPDLLAVGAGHVYPLAEVQRGGDAARSNGGRVAPNHCKAGRERRRRELKCMAVFPSAARSAESSPLAITL